MQCGCSAHITPSNSGRPERSGFCGKKSEAIPQKLRSVERSTIATAIGAARDCYDFSETGSSLNLGKSSQKLNHPALESTKTWA